MREPLVLHPLLFFSSLSSLWRRRKRLTGVSKRGSDLDGCEVLQERLELQGGELRPPLAAGPLVQSVQKKTEEIQTMFQEDDVSSLYFIVEPHEPLRKQDRFCVSSYCFANIWTASDFLTKSIQMCSQMCKQERIWHHDDIKSQ